MMQKIDIARGPIFIAYTIFMSMIDISTRPAVLIPNSRENDVFTK